MGKQGRHGHEDPLLYQNRNEELFSRNARDLGQLPPASERNNREEQAEEHQVVPSPEADRSHAFLL